MGTEIAAGRIRWNLVSYLIDKFQLTGAAQSAVIVGGILLCMIAAYLLGSLNFGVIISKRLFGDDVRTHGSGNAGATNVLRTYGVKAAVFTLVGDMLKAAIAVGLGYLIFNGQYEVMYEGKLSVAGDKYGAAISGLFVIFGHMFPCFYKFKGGKGVATAGMVALMINPLAFLILFAIFVIIVAFTKYVSLGSVMGVCLYPIILSAFEAPQGSYACTAAAVLIAIAITYMHRGNIKRLYHGEESKISLKKKESDSAETDTVLKGKAKKAAKKQAYEANKEAAAQEAETNKVWTDDKFVTCTGCGKTIPRSRRKCAYCNAVNAQYQPDAGEQKGKDGKKRK